MNSRKSRAVSWWLLLGCFMVLIQIILGGITRLTDSGLSITEWNVIKGTLPPLNEKEWMLSFEKYKAFANKQYISIHREMSLAQFKSIYFWEYFHRLWARLMSFVFFVPFVFFWIRKKIDNKLLNRLAVVIFLASLSAIFGWIMVASGLNDDKRTWVNAYNLLIHLVLATSLFAYLLYTYYIYNYESLSRRVELKNYKLLILIGACIGIQLMLGALVAGMKAALVFPYPFILAKWGVFKSIAQSAPISSIDWYDYEPNSILKLIVQSVHRLTAYLIGVFSIFFFYINRQKWLVMPSHLSFFIILIVQIVLGIVTVMNSIGKIPVLWGVVHQAMAFLLLSSYLWILFSSRKRK